MADPNGGTTVLVGVGPWTGPVIAGHLAERAGGTPGVEIVGVADPVDPAAAHLVVDGPGRPDDGMVDVRLADDRPETVERLWTRRVVPFARNLARGRRAPRTQVVALERYDQAWPAAARRIGRRIAVALGTRALVVEHIGSTSVPGMTGKDLVDVLVVVPDLAAVDAVDPADWHRAGVVPVTGTLYGIDRHDREHPQRVAVDADPGRPVNVHLHPQSSPVWREQLAFRDWLRADATRRAAYLDLKRRVAHDAEGDVNAYGRAKRSWINAAVAEALPP